MLKKWAQLLYNADIVIYKKNKKQNCIIKNILSWLYSFLSHNITNCP